MAEYQCKQCGKTFIPKHSKYHTYCCYQCFTDYRNCNSRLTTAVCPVCEKPFNQSVASQKYCSQECQWESLKGKNRKRQEIPCKQCGTMFYPQKAGTIFCSRQCAGEFRRVYASKQEAKRAWKKKERERLEPIRAAITAQKLLQKQEAKAKADQQLPKMRICLECSQPFEVSHNRLCCSDACSKKRKNRIRDINRRHKLRENGEVDYSITIQRLVKRDKNICHICGSKCNMKDCITRDDAFIAGDAYPSIDHLFPVSRGGTHSWDNIKLAHRKCNYEKSDQVSYVRTDGQVVFAL